LKERGKYVENFSAVGTKSFQLSIDRVALSLLFATLGIVRFFLIRDFILLKKFINLINSDFSLDKMT
jgi:hypothetical protein